MLPQTQNETLLVKRMSLPEAWIDRIFERLSCFYGSKFADMWRGTDPVQLKAVWSEKLAGFHDRPEIIRHALESLDDRPWPPTLPEFLEVCRNQARRLGPVPLPQLNAPTVTREQMAEATREIEHAATKPKEYDYRGWCKELKRRYLAGEDLLPIQISMASEAMGEVWDKRECRPKEAA